MGHDTQKAQITHDRKEKILKNAIIQIACNIKEIIVHDTQKAQSTQSRRKNTIIKNTCKIKKINVHDIHKATKHTW